MIKMATDQRLKLLHNARREAWMVLLIWAVFLVWVVGYSYLRGYQRPTESAASSPPEASLTIVLGIPEWVSYGIFLPWLVAMVLTVFFGLKVIQDDDLGEDKDEGSSASEEDGSRAAGA